MRLFASWLLPAERGQASVELVAILPALVVVGLVAWQLVLAGHTLWLCANAARVAARAAAVGRAPEPAARSALPEHLERGLRVERSESGSVEVRVAMPLIVHAWRAPVPVAASAYLGDGDAR